MIQTGATTPVENKSVTKGNEEVLHIPQRFRTGAPLSYAV